MGNNQAMYLLLDDKVLLFWEWIADVSNSETSCLQQFLSPIVSSVIYSVLTIITALSGQKKLTYLSLFFIVYYYLPLFVCHCILLQLRHPLFYGKITH